MRLRGCIVGAVLMAAALLACGAFGGGDASPALGGNGGDAGAASPDGGTALVDAGAASSDAGAIELNDPCADGGAHRLMFVTSGTFRGDLGAGDSGVTGLAAANARCNEAARSGQLPGTYVAWVSTTKDHPTLNPQSKVPILLPNGCQLVANDLADLGTNGPKVTPNATETGGLLAAPCWVWSATTPNGTSQVTTLAPQTTCQEWTTASPDAGGYIGECSTMTNWTFFGGMSCDTNDGHLYCLQN